MKFRELQVGEKFVYQEKIYEKTNLLGELFFFLNCRSEKGVNSWISCDAEVEKLNDKEKEQ